MMKEFMNIFQSWGTYNSYATETILLLISNGLWNLREWTYWPSTCVFWQCAWRGHGCNTPHLPAVVMTMWPRRWLPPPHTHTKSATQLGLSEKFILSSFTSFMLSIEEIMNKEFARPSQSWCIWLPILIPIPIRIGNPFESLRLQVCNKSHTCAFKESQQASFCGLPN